jgi:hypothetical protein
MDTTKKRVDIHSTKNFSMFKYFSSNRKIDKNHLNRLMASVEEKNLLKDFPILVNSDYYVLDGQTRLEVAKQLDIPIFYRISKDMIEDDISLINSNCKTWQLDDYLKSWVDKKNQDYLKLERFMLTYGISLSNSLIILEGQWWSGNGKNKSNFRRGIWQYPVNDFHARQIVLELKQFEDRYGISFKDKRSFILAYSAIRKDEQFDIKRMQRKLKSSESNSFISFVHGKDCDGYIRSLGDLYNHKLGKNEVSIRFRAEK